MLTRCRLALPATRVLHLSFLVKPATLVAVQSAAEKVIPATLIPGDGIGPEIIDAVVMVLDALGAPFAWEQHKAGMPGVEEHGDPLQRPTLDSIRRTRLALKGPLTTPVGGGYRSSNVRLREEFHL